MTRDNEFRAYLTFVGDFNPVLITEALGLEPTSSWRKGDINERTHFERKFSRWSLESRLPSGVPLVEHMRDVLAQTESNQSQVAALRDEYEGHMQLVAHFYTESPWFSFDEDVVAGCAAMKLAIDCDFYTMYSDRREDS